MIANIKNRWLRGLAAWAVLIGCIFIIGPLMAVTSIIHAVECTVERLQKQWGGWAGIRQTLVPLLKFERDV